MEKSWNVSVYKLINKSSDNLVEIVQNWLCLVLKSLI